MTSNHLLFKENFKKNIWAMVLSLVLFLFQIVLPTLIIYTNNFLDQEGNFITENLPRYQEELNRLPIYGGIGVLFVLSIVMGIKCFSYIQNKKQVDFYHSLPIKRKTLFFQNFSFGILNVIPAYIISTIVLILLYYTLGFSTIIDLTYIIKGIIWNIVFYLTIYSIFCLATIVTGNTLISFLFGTFLLSIQWLIKGIVMFLFYSPFDSPIYSLWEFAFKNPFPAMFLYNIENSNLEVSNVFSLFQPNYTKILISYLILTIIIILVSYILFLNRKSEKSNCCIAFDWLKTPLKYLGVITGAFYIGLFFNIITADSKIWVIAGAVIGSILLHCITEMVYEFDFKAIFKNWISIIICGVLSVSLCLIAYKNFTEDFTQGRSKEVVIPNIEKVVAVDLSSSYIEYGEPLVEKETIEDAMKLIEIASKQLEERINNPDLNNFHGIIIDLGYKLKNGKVKYLQLYIKRTKEVADLINKLKNNKEIILKRDKLFDENLYFGEDFYIPNRVGNIKILNNNGNFVNINDLDEMKGFIEILKTDILNNIDKEKGEVLYNVYIESISSYTIYSNYTETIKFIQEKANLKPENLSLENIEEINYLEDINLDNGITDKEIIEYILQNSKPNKALEIGNKSVNFKLKNKSNVERIIEEKDFEKIKNYLKSKGIE